MRRRSPQFAFLLATGLGLAGTALSQGVDFSGSVTGDLRYFTQPAGFPGQTMIRNFPSLRFETRLSYGWNDGADRLVLSPFLRLDQPAGGRAHTDLREAYWLHQGDDWSLTVGVDKVFWGVTESRNLVDIINQDDVLEDLSGGEKLGQPMVSLSFYQDWGTLDLYVLPLFRPRQFLPFGARLAGPVPIGPAAYAAPDGRNHVDFALRWSQSFGDWDVGLSHFQGTSREPRMIPAGPVLVPFYDQIGQTGLDVQLTAGDWLWKLEAMTRTGQGPRFWAATAGFEWALPGVAGSGADLSLMAEWSYDGRDPVLAPVTLYDNDLFLGARLGFSDIGSTSLSAGVLIDSDTDARVFLVEGQRRLGESWILGLEGRFFVGGTMPDPIAAIAADDYVEMTLKWSF